MNKQWLLVFGTHPALSLAEVEGWGEAHGVTLTIESAEGEMACVSGVPEALQSKFAQDLAGVVKIGEVVLSRAAVVPKREDDLVEFLSGVLQGPVEDMASVTFGSSWYGRRQHLPAPRTQERIALELKKKLKENGRHVRWVNGRGRPLTSVQVAKNKLEGERGVELLIWATAERFVVARTVAVQAFEDWGERDFGRPRRNAKQGMLPPKLAHMMVNLLGLPSAGTLLDPCCGSGTVLMEAALLGWTSLVGSDLNPLAVKDTEQNMSWLEEHHKFTREFSARYVAASIERLSEHVKPGTIQAIVTEPYLGPPMARPPTEVEMSRFERELAPLYRATLTAAAKLLALNGRIVLALPVWFPATGKPRSFTFLSQSLPPALRFHRRPFDLVYARQGQAVGRSLVILEKVTREM